MPLPPSTPPRLATAIRWIVAVLGVLFVFNIFSFAYAWLSGTSLTDLLWVTAGSLKEDDAGRTNFLLLGTGGEGHPGADLTDTMMVASYDHERGTFAFLSIPRDLWIETAPHAGMRINNVYMAEKERAVDDATALARTTTVVSDIVGVPIQYYVKIRFQGLVDAVDALGGLDITVERPIDDATYPCDDDINFCPIHIAAGTQHFDGDLALKYARSRHTTSDFDRAARQQRVLEAMREKALSADILGSPRHLRAIYTAATDNLTTNLDWREMILLAKLAKDFDRSRMVNAVLSDDPNQTGGLLYAPAREAYGGASVLLPEGDDFRAVHRLTSVLFGAPQTFVDQLPIEVLNASGQPRVAEKVAYFFNRYGFNTAKINNYPNREKRPRTVLYFYRGDTAESEELDTKIAETAAALSTFTSGVVEAVPGPVDLAGRGYPLVLVVGADYRAADYE